MSEELNLECCKHKRREEEEYFMVFPVHFVEYVGFMEKEVIDLNNKAKNIKDLQEAADYFLKSCYNVGINYEKR